jgi:hypothetical protein
MVLRWTAAGMLRLIELSLVGFGADDGNRTRVFSLGSIFWPRTVF